VLHLAAGCLAVCLSIMSTFGGVMSEFPDVRVDYFRPVNGLRPPLATFLSHIHSDHRAGLDTYMGAL